MIAINENDSDQRKWKCQPTRFWQPSRKFSSLRTSANLGSYNLIRTALQIALSWNLHYFMLLCCLTKLFKKCAPEINLMVWWALQNSWGENVIESIHISLNLFIFFIFYDTLTRNHPLPSHARGRRLFSGFRGKLHLLHTQSGRQPQEGCMPKNN